jgi:hypothetical protein
MATPYCAYIQYAARSTAFFKGRSPENALKIRAEVAGPFAAGADGPRAAVSIDVVSPAGQKSDARSWQPCPSSTNGQRIRQVMQSVI